MPSYYSKTTEVNNYLYSALNTNRVTLGLKAVWPAMKDLTANMPALVMEPQNKTKVRHSVGGAFRRNFTINIYVAHSKLSITSQARTQEDWGIVEAVVAFLDSDKRLGGNLNGDSYVTREEYGALATPKQGYVKGTRIVWEGFSIV